MSDKLCSTYILVFDIQVWSDSLMQQAILQPKVIFFISVTFFLFTFKCCGLLFEKKKKYFHESPSLDHV